MIGLAFPKPRPSKLQKADRTKARVSIDTAESAKVKARSGGRCEVVEELLRFPATKRATEKIIMLRCHRRGNQTHHMIGGWGKRARGISIFAERKQWVCPTCHSDIGAHVLQRIGGPVPHYTDSYRRVT